LYCTSFCFCTRKREEEAGGEKKKDEYGHKNGEEAVGHDQLKSRRRGGKRGRRKRGRRKREEGRGKREEGRGKREEDPVIAITELYPHATCTTGAGTKICWGR
jgi:hypothetical protein